MAPFECSFGQRREDSTNKLPGGGKDWAGCAESIDGLSAAMDEMDKCRLIGGVPVGKDDHHFFCRLDTRDFNTQNRV